MMLTSSRPLGYNRQLGTLLQTGELCAGRHPRPLLKALQRFRAEQTASPGLRVDFGGWATERRFGWSTELRRCGLQDAIHIEGHVSYWRGLQRVARSDILLLIQRTRYGASTSCRPVPALADVPGIEQALVELSEAVCRSRLGGAMPTTLHTLPRDQVGQHFAAFLDREVLAAKPLAHL
jgi:hypothetical protein